MKADKYFESISKHFARKVEVVRKPGLSIVHFPMGQCLIELVEQTMRFSCQASTRDGLVQMQSIVASHVTMFGELKEATICWSEGGGAQDG